MDISPRSVVFVVGGCPKAAFSYAVSDLTYARHACAGLLATGRDFMPEIIGFHDAATEHLVLDGIEVTLLANQSARPIGAVGLNPALWDRLKRADLVHVLQPAHNSGAAALVAARSLKKPLVASYLGDGGLGLMLWEGGLSLADRLLFHQRELLDGLAKSVGERGLLWPAPVDRRHYAPLRLPRHGLVCADPLRDGSAALALIAALPNHLPLHFCGDGQTPELVAKLMEAAGEKPVSMAVPEDALALRHAFCFAQAAVSTLPATFAQALWLSEAEACGTPRWPTGADLTAAPPAILTPMADRFGPLLRALYHQLLAEAEEPA